MQPNQCYRVLLAVSASLSLPTVQCGHSFFSFYFSNESFTITNEALLQPQFPSPSARHGGGIKSRTSPTRTPSRRKLSAMSRPPWLVACSTATRLQRIQPPAWPSVIDSSPTGTRLSSARHSVIPSVSTTSVWSSSWDEPWTMPCSMWG